MTETSAAPRSFAHRFLSLMGEAGWRIVLHVLPYAVACGVITEGTLQLRLSLPWKLPMVALVLASLFLAVLLGTHVAKLRLLARRDREPAPLRHLLRMAWRISLESATVALIGAIAALALVGALDVALALVGPEDGAAWSRTLLRAIATLSGLGALMVVLAGGTALAGSTEGAGIGVPAAARRLFARSERTTAILCTAIFAGTVLAIAATRLVTGLDWGPPVIAAALAKALGFLALVIPLSSGAALLADED